MAKQSFTRSHSVCLQKAQKIVDILEEMDPEQYETGDWDEELDEFVDTVQEFNEVEPDLYAAVLGESSGKGRIREYLKQTQGQVVTSEELARVSGIKEYARRVRELRNEEGFVTDSTRTRPDLGSHEYILKEIREVEDKTRVPPKARQEYIKDHPACEHCGFNPQEHNGTGGANRYLEVDHIKSYIDFDDPEKVNDPENLQTLCNVCHKGKSTSDDISNRRGKDKED